MVLPRSGRLLRLSGRALSDPASIFQHGDVGEISKSRLVIFGEIHAAPAVVKMQHEVQKNMVKRIINEATTNSNKTPRAKLHVVMEHFSLDMQPMLDKYCRGDMDLAALAQEYRVVGTEGHDVTAYKEVLEFARENPQRCVLHGGFIPRTYAKTLMQEGVDVALEKAKRKGFVADEEDCWATENHYRYFESLLTGRDPQDLTRPLSEQYRRMLPAQVLKDASMAHRVNQLVADWDANKGDRVLVLCGNGHMGFGHGVPERIFKKHPRLRSEATSVYSRPALLDVDEQVGLRLPDDMSGVLHSVVPAAEGDVAADFCFVYQDTAAMEAERVKQESIKAYDRVGDTAHLEGDIKKAVRIMTLLGYSASEIAFAGRDACNYQGVGHPHKHAEIREGEVVLDLGSGLGVDSLIASSKVGAEGKVVGVDISEGEVRHATKRATERQANVRFVHADLEELPIPDECIDVVISNGAFCLVPNKVRGFQETYRVLKPGGRMVVCTSTVKGGGLEDGVKWPICMKVFARLDDLVPMVSGVGFEDVKIDMSDSKMAQELEEEVEEGDTDARGRKQVHGGGGKEFKHLQNFDMNELCARVVVVARKPEKGGSKEAKGGGPGGCPYV